MNIVQIFIVILAIFIIGALFYNSTKALNNIDFIPDEKLDQYIVSTEPWARLMHKIRSIFEDKEKAVMKDPKLESKPKEQVSDRVKRLRKAKAKQDFIVTTFFEVVGVMFLFGVGYFLVEAAKVGKE